MNVPVHQAIVQQRRGDALAGAVAHEDRASGERGIPLLDQVYRSCFIDVARWVRALGANPADIEDLTQEVFIIVGRKLASFDGRNLPGFLYRIARRTVRDHRRSAWIRRLTGRRARVPDLPAHGPSALQVLQDRERQHVVEGILAKMSEARRTTFVLFEIEGYSGEEIAQIQLLPLNTVWTRLHHARKDFLRMVSQLPREEDDG
jgi:RNA polymerase sigma-70 factor (ECF subfamily)